MIYVNVIEEEISTDNPSVVILKADQDGKFLRVQEVLFLGETELVHFPKGIGHAGRFHIPHILLMTRSPVKVKFTWDDEWTPLEEVHPSRWNFTDSLD